MKTTTLILAGMLTTLTAIAQGSLTSGGFTSSGAYQLQVQGGPHQIEFSTNLTAWQPDANSRGMIIDMASTNSEWRFYRAKAGENFASNVVGYVRVPVEPGKMVLVASPFRGSLRLDEAGRRSVFGTATPAVQVSLMQGGRQTSYTFDDLDNNWSPALPEIPQGTGFFVRNVGQQRIHVSFHGELPQGTLKRSIPQGDALVAPLVPKPGPIQDALGAVPIEGAQLLVWNEEAQAYQTSTFQRQANRWIPSLNYKPGRGILIKYQEPAFQVNFLPTR